MRLYWELARRGYRRFAAYPAATVAGVFTNTIFGFMRGYILLAVLAERPSIGGYDATRTITYVWLGQGLLATVSIWGWTELALRIRTGDIATDLARPVHPLASGLAFDLGRALYQALYRGLPPFAIGALVFELTAPESPVVWLAFVVSVALAVAVSFAFRFLYNLAAFWLGDFRGVTTLAVIASLFFSGFTIPLSFFPDWLETFARATPFAAMAQVPIDIFVGRTSGAEIAAALAFQVGWAIALAAAGWAVFGAGTRRLVVQGG